MSADAEEATAATTHGPVPEGLECMITYEDITEEDGNYCEYQTAPSLAWHPAKITSACVVHLQDTQFEKWTTRVQETDCQAELRRLLSGGPPVWVYDEHALPVPDGDTHVCALWFAEDKQERSAMLKGAVTGEEREELWEAFRKFQIEGAEGEEEAAAGEQTAAEASGEHSQTAP